MAKTLNKRLVGSLLLGAVVVTAAAGFVVMQNLPGQDPSMYLETAKKAEAEGNTAKALDAYLRAYQKDRTQNPQLLVDAARCALAEGAVRDVREFLARARVTDPTMKAAAELSTRVELELGRLAGASPVQWKRVHEEATKLLVIDKESALGQEALGTACLQLLDEEPTYREIGESALRRAIELDPANVEAVKSLVMQLDLGEVPGTTAEKGKAQEERKLAAKDVLAAAIEKCKAAGDVDKNVELRRFEARLAMTRGETQKGLALARALAQEYPKRANCCMDVGSFLLSTLSEATTSETQEAVYTEGEKHLRQAVDLAPDDGEVHIRLANLYQQRGRAEDELKVYVQGLESVKFSKHFRAFQNNRYRALMIYHLCLSKLRGLSGAPEAQRTAAFNAIENWIEMLKKEQAGDTPQVLCLKAHVASARGDIKLATSLVEAADKQSGALSYFELETLKAQLYYRQEQWGSARKALETALQIQPAAVNLHIMLAQVYLKMSLPAEAIRRLRPDGPESLRRYLLNDKMAIGLCIEAYKELKQFDQAAEENKRLAQLTGDAGGGRMRDAKLLIVQEKYPEAEAILKELMKDPAQENESVRALLYIYQFTQRPDEAKALVKDALVRHPDDRDYKELELAVGAEGGKLDDERLLKFIQEEPDAFGRAMALYNYHVFKKNIPEAKKQLDEAERLRPTDPMVIERKLLLAVRDEDWPAAERYAAKDAEINSDGTKGRITYGRIALAKKEYSRAIELMKAGLSDDQGFPNYSMGWVYLAQAYLEAGQPSDARRSLLRALDIDPTNGYANRGMADISARDGDAEAEERYLRLAQRSLPNDPLVLRNLEIIDEKKNPEKGIATREKLLATDASNLENMIRLARLYRQAKQYDKAADMYRRSLETSKRDLQVAREVAAFFALPEVNRPAEGEKVLNDLMHEQTEVSKKALVAVYLAVFYEGQKRMTQAEQHYRLAVSFEATPEVLTRAAEFYMRTSRLKEAVDYFDRVRKEAKPDDKDSRRSASARIISLLLAKGDMERVKGEVESFVRDFPDDSQGRVFLGTFHLLGGDIVEAEKAFSAELELRSDNATALWQRGQLYSLRERWQLAIDDLSRSKTYAPEAFGYQHRIALADALVEVGRGDEAVLELRSILEPHPDNQAVAAALVNVLMRLNPPRYSDAEGLIVQYASRYPQEVNWPMLHGRLGEMTQNWDRAIAAYESAAELTQFSPQVVQTLFAALAKANRPAEVLKYAESRLSSKRLDEAPLALCEVGWAYKQTRQEDKGLAAFERAMDVSQTELFTYNRVVARMVENFDKEHVLARVKTAAEAAPNDVRRLKNYLHLLFLNKKTEEGGKVAAKIIDLATSNQDAVFARMALAKSEEDAGHYDKAKGLYEAVLKIEPDEVVALNNLAYLLVDRIKNPEEALPYAQRAARLVPRSKEILDTLAWTYLKVGRTGEALTMGLRALEDNRQNAAMLYHVGCIHQARGEKREAVEKLKKAAEYAAGGRFAEYLPMIKSALKELGESVD